MMKKQFALFIVRWILNSFGLWIAVRLLGTNVSESVVNDSYGLFLLAGFIFSLLNSILRPLVIVLSLPAIMLTLGFFMFVVNGFMVWITIQMTPQLEMTFLHSIFAGMLLSLINYIVSAALELQGLKEEER